MSLRVQTDTQEMVIRLEVLPSSCDSAKAQGDKEQHLRLSGRSHGGEQTQDNSWCAGGMIKTSLQGETVGG